MTLNALLTPLVVPPVNLAVLALLALGLRWRRVAIVLLGLLLLLALPLLSNAMMRGLEDGLSATGEPAGAQAILVLGGDLDRGRDGLVVPGSLTLERLRDAAALARRTGLPLAVTGGPAWDGGPAIGTIMATSLREDFGLPVRWIETGSADTWENARNSAALFKAAGIDKVVVVTHAWHMRRSLLAFRNYGLVVIPAPVWRFGYPPGSVAGTLMPRATTWQDSYFALHEWIGIGWYDLRATFGNRSRQAIKDKAA